MSDSLREKILACEVVNRGEWFTARQLARHLDRSVGSVQFELRQMVEDELFLCDHGDHLDAGKYQRRSLNTQWINKARLCDAKGLKQAREQHVGV